jgi:predicted transcriptional regulator
VATKHEQILEHIESLAIGSRISVRGIARDLQVSEGTAYRAIKDAEIQGFVSSMDRIGTVRIEKKQPRQIERLTFAEVVNIVEGTVLGGRGGLHKTLQKFVIGAMEVNAIVRYIDPGSLMIVGNREQVQKMSLEHGAAVLITGGFEVSREVERLANEKELPLISCSYDTFTTATLINRAIYERLIKKDILFVEDVVSNQELVVLTREHTIRDYFELVEKTGHARMPVVDANGKLIGVVTARDVGDASGNDSVETCMSRQPVTVSLKTTIASAAHRMVWEGVEMLPVTHNRKVVGVLSRQDVLKALQIMNRQPQMGETLEDSVVQGFETIESGSDYVFIRGDVTAQMTSGVGTVASGTLTTLIQHAATLCLQRRRHVDMVVENLSLYLLKPVSVDSVIELRAHILDFGRRFAKVEVEVMEGQELSAKALLTTQVLER